MSIESVYKTLLANTLIKSKVKELTIPSAEEVQEEINALVAGKDLSRPQFTEDTWKVDPGESASVKKFNGTFSSIKQDIRVLYKEMLNLTKTGVEAFERWGLETDLIEKRLIDIEDRIENLVLLTKDLEGFRYFFVENFSDLDNTDLILTDALVDLGVGEVSISPVETEPTRIFLNNLISNQDITFRVRTSIGFVGRNDAVNSELANVFKQVSTPWWTRVEMNKPTPVVAELTVALGDEPISVNRIFLSLHDSVQSAPLVVTPLYSIDNYNFSQLPTDTFTQEIRTKGSFSFPSTEMKFVKFVLTKVGPDPGVANEISYQFGFKTIQFFQESFSTSASQTFVSKPISIPDTNGNNLQFSKITLETCERVDGDSDVDYFIAASNDADLPVTGNTIWLPISPINREEKNQPSILDLASLSEVTIGESEDLIVSSDQENGNDISSTFNLISQTNNQIVDESITESETRYVFENDSDAILNYQIKDIDYSGSGSGGAVSIDENTIELFRNIGEKGLDSTESSSFVRGVMRGWGFQEPYYSTVIQILDPGGMSLEVGNSPIIIDDIAYTNFIPNTVLTGKGPNSSGIHRILVHKNNWVHVTPELSTLAGLKSADPLYPYNHKLLIEGYKYNGLYPSSDEKIYIGVNIFAEYLMKRVGIFNFIDNVPGDDYKRYSLDRDAVNSHTGGNKPTRVFLVKTDNSESDFQNEKFQLRFNIVDQKFTYFRLRADLSTEDSSVGPVIDSYKVKLG